MGDVVDSALEVFRDIAPEFADMADEDVKRYIGYVLCQVSAQFFGCDYYLALAYLAADMIAMTKRSSGSAGIASSKKEGNLAISYGVPDDTSYVTTYGQRFLNLRKMHIFAARVANEQKQ